MNLKKHIITILICMPFVITTNVDAQTDTTRFVYYKPLFDFDYNEPVFKLENEQLNNKNRMLRFVAFTGYREGVKPIQGSMGANFQRFNIPGSGVARIAMYNLSIVEMLFHFPIHPSRVILKVKDPSRYMYDPKYGSKEEWMRKNAWCYEYLIPENLVSGAKQFEDDIATYFGIKVRREKRMVTETERYGLSADAGNKEVTIFVITEIN